MTAKKTTEETVPDDTDDTYTEDDNYTEDTPTFLPMQPDVKSTDGIPARARKTSANFEEWAPTIETLRTTDLGQSYGYNNVANVGSVVQGLKKTYGITAVRRNVITKKIVDDGRNNGQPVGSGSLWIEYPHYVDSDGAMFPDEDAVAKNKIEARD